MKKRFKILGIFNVAHLVCTLFAGSCLLMATGCLEADIKLKIHRNASAQLEIHTFIHDTHYDPFLERLFIPLGLSITEQKKALSRESTWRAMTPRFGKGIQFIRLEKIQRADGASGLASFYEIKNINTFNLTSRAIPLFPLNQCDFNWSYAFSYKPLEPKRITVFSPRARRNPDAISARAYLKGIADLPGIEQLFSKALRHTRIHVDIFTEEKTSLLKIDLAPFLDSGGITFLLDIKDTEGIYQLHRRKFPGIFLQTPGEHLVLSLESNP